MAREQVTIEMVDKLTAKLGKMEKNFVSKMDKMQKKTTSMGTILKAVFAGNIMNSAIRGVQRFAKHLIIGSIKAAAFQQQVENRLSAAIKNNADITEDATPRLIEYAASLQKITTVGDETIIGIQALLARFAKTEDEIKGATVATLDFAAGIGVDTKAAALLMAKALDGEVSSLSRYAIKIKEGLDETEKFDAVLAAVTKKFGGAAQAETLTFSGKLKILGNVYGDLLEKIGFATIESNDFKIAMKDVSDFLSDPSTVSSVVAISSAFVNVAESVLKAGKSFTRGVFFLKILRQENERLLAGEAKRFKEFGADQQRKILLLNLERNTQAKIIKTLERIRDLQAFNVTGSESFLVETSKGSGIFERFDTVVSALKTNIAGLREQISGVKNELSGVVIGANGLLAPDADALAGAKDFLSQLGGQDQGGAFDPGAQAPAGSIFGGGGQAIEGGGDFSEGFGTRQEIELAQFEFEQSIRDMGIEAIEADNEKRIALEQNLASKITSLNQQKNATILGLTQQLGGALIAATGASGKKQFLLQKALATGISIVSAFQASSLALATPPGPPVTIPLAAATLKAGLFNAAAIAATALTGGGGGGGGGSSIGSIGGTSNRGATNVRGAIGNVNGPDKDTGNFNITVQIEGNVIGNTDFADEIADAIKDRVGDGRDFGVQVVA